MSIFFQVHLMEMLLRYGPSPGLRRAFACVADRTKICRTLHSIAVSKGDEGEIEITHGYGFTLSSGERGKIFAKQVPKQVVGNCARDGVSC